MSDRELTQFAYRSQKAIGVFNAPPAAAEELVLPNKPTDETKALGYSANGKYLAWSSATEVRIVDAESLNTVSVIARPSIVSVQFSPSGTYVVTWERYNKSDDFEASQNLRVWDSVTGEQRGAFTQKTFSDRALQWTDDERYCAKLFSGEVRFYAPTALSKAALTLKLDGITAFSVSPGLAPSVAVFVPERGSKPALVRMYAVGAFTRAVANKTFFKAESVDFHWHKLGTNLLVMTHTEVDKTGRSYYGESSLYFLAAAGNFDCRVVLNQEGPIHDVAWNPVEKEFVVVYGFMPARAALFNHRAEMVFDFGVAHRNYVRFNPHGRVLVIAGFGNLSGVVDLWDRKKLKKLCSIDGHGTSSCEWGPDGRHLMTATLSPRLRVDNGIRIWHYTGTLVFRQEFKELYQVDWRPANIAKFPQRSALSPAPPGIAVVASSSASTEAASDSASANSSAATPASATPAAPPKPAGAYRPPHARTREATGNGAPRSLSDIAERVTFGSPASAAHRAVPGAAYVAGGNRIPVGATPDMAAKAAAAAATDKKSRRRNRKKTKADGSDYESDAPSVAAGVATDSESKPAASSSSADIEALKRIRVLKKKVGQIDALTKKRDDGEILAPNQQAKLDSRSQIESEITQLSASLTKLNA
ncbi:hypothetical protein GGI01_002245 [Coemansia sp. RSA 376]|nr:hypothetical protein GGI14_003038 [Coemansia sp. S680]KAJ2037964.1 hypothetical protein H4S03_002639 [Coemansia sp. S3946]KAJ2050192.1 hypothetical protein H4S04_002750 [Coemansia sp. S16]KAJ2261496.1 hypothetical protein GGI01_002245 [Coemansia sp. RSA 376]